MAKIIIATMTINIVKASLATKTMKEQRFVSKPKHWIGVVFAGFLVVSLNSAAANEVSMAPTVNDKQVADQKKLSKRAKRSARKAKALEAVLSQVEEGEEQGARCISTVQIRDTDVISNRAIIFYMRHKKILINPLPHRCPGLHSSDTFMYETQAGRLCRLDSITVLDNIGTQFLRGARCGLGRFYEITEDQVDLLKGKQRDISQGSIEAE